MKRRDQRAEPTSVELAVVAVFALVVIGIALATLGVAVLPAQWHP